MDPEAQLLTDALEYMSTEQWEEYTEATTGDVHSLQFYLTRQEGGRAFLDLDECLDAKKQGGGEVRSETCAALLPTAESGAVPVLSQCADVVLARAALAALQTSQLPLRDTIVRVALDQNLGGTRNDPLLASERWVIEILDLLELRLVALMDGTRTFGEIAAVVASESSGRVGPEQALAAAGKLVVHTACLQQIVVTTPMTTG